VSRRIKQAFAVLSLGFVYLGVSAACFPNFFKSRSIVSLVLAELKVAADVTAIEG
jgi:hypothetical protein